AADRWIMARLQQTADEMKQAFANYRLDLAAQAIYDFTWNEYCDWYLELSKPVLNDENSSESLQRGTRKTLVTVLDAILRLSHPIMPFITEEIWQRVAPLVGNAGETIMSQAYPEQDTSLLDADAIKEMEWVKNFILGIRKIRGEMNIPPGKPLPVLLQNGDAADQQLLEKHQLLLSTLAKTESIRWLQADDKAPESAIALVGNMRLLIPMAGLIDKEAEIARLSKGIEKLEKDVQRITSKLENANFVDRAPADVVEKERQKLTELQSALDNLRAQLEKIQKL
ncbi:class I tRNA ligase family protein, partial [Kaarinaea lacus]